MRRVAIVAVTAIALTVGVALRPGGAPARTASVSQVALQAQMTALRRSLPAIVAHPRVVPLAGAGTCFVGSGGCSLTPCIEFVGQSALPTIPSYVMPSSATQCVSRPKVSANAVLAAAQVAAATPAPAASR
jgi:hypothetical protein